MKEKIEKGTNKNSLIWQLPTYRINNGNTNNSFEYLSIFFFFFIFIIFRQSTKCTQSHKVN